MAKKMPSFKVRRSGAYHVKAAEGRSSRVEAKPSKRSHQPSSSDRKLARELLRNHNRNSG